VLVPARLLFDGEPSGFDPKQVQEVPDDQEAPAEQRDEHRELEQSLAAEARRGRLPEAPDEALIGAPRALFTPPDGAHPSAIIASVLRADSSLPSAVTPGRQRRL
jgi:hypothetical protein